MTDSTTRFSDRVEAYVRYRPRYPGGVLDVLRSGIGLDADWIVADVGSGTGFSAELFLDGGCVVHAIEPNAEMRTAAEAHLGGRTGFHSHAGRAEATGLADSTIDLVVAGQAFHWFDPVASRDEFRRILRQPKWTVLMWNRRLTAATAFLESYEALLQEFGTDYAEVRHDRLDMDALREFYAAPPERHVLPSRQAFDFEGLKGRLLSSSYVPGPDHIAFPAMVSALHEVYNRHEVNGVVRFEYATEIFIGRLQ
jgi:SAM-dependent methyltransferase